MMSILLSTVRKLETKQMQIHPLIDTGIFPLKMKAFLNAIAIASVNPFALPSA